MAMCRAAEWNIKKKKKGWQETKSGSDLRFWGLIRGSNITFFDLEWFGGEGELTSEVIRATEDVWYQSDWVMNGSTVFAGNAKNRSEIMLLKRVWWSRNTYSGSFRKVPWDLDHGISNSARHGQSGHERRRKHVWNVLSAESTGSTRAGADGCSLLDCAEILCRIVGNL